MADNKSEYSIIPATLPERMPDTCSLHQYFTSAILLDCSQLNNDEVPEQVLQHSTSNIVQDQVQLSSLQQAYTGLLLRYDVTLADLQNVLTSFSSAVLRVSQSIQGPASKLLVQHAYAAAEEVHASLEKHQRCEQLLVAANTVLYGSEALCDGPQAARAHAPGSLDDSNSPVWPSHCQAALQQCMAAPSQHSWPAAAPASIDGTAQEPLLPDQGPVVSWL